MHAKYEVSISYSSKVIANVKVDNRQTKRQDKNNMNLYFVTFLLSGSIYTRIMVLVPVHLSRYYYSLRHIYQTTEFLEFSLETERENMNILRNKSKLKT